MRKNKFNLWNSLTILISILLPFGLLPISSQAIAQDKNLNETLFTIPIGDNGVHYEGLDNPDEEVWGPAGFTVASDGSFWIQQPINYCNCQVRGTCCPKSTSNHRSLG